MAGECDIQNDPLYKHMVIKKEKKRNREEKLQANMTNRRTAIVPKISSEIWTVWLYILTTRLTSIFLFKLIVEHDGHVTGISGQYFSCSNKMTDCLQWLHTYVWYWHGDMCSFKLNSNSFEDWGSGFSKWIAKTYLVTNLDST